MSRMRDNYNIHQSCLCLYFKIQQKQILDMAAHGLCTSPTVARSNDRSLRRCTYLLCCCYTLLAWFQPAYNSQQQLYPCHVYNRSELSLRYHTGEARLAIPSGIQARIQPCTTLLLIFPASPRHSLRTSNTTFPHPPRTLYRTKRLKELGHQQKQ